MKKNVVGHMVASKDKTTGRFRRWDVLPRLICLLLAIVIWLIVADLTKVEPDKTGAPTEIEEGVL